MIKEMVRNPAIHFIISVSFVFLLYYIFTIGYMAMFLAGAMWHGNSLLNAL